jgi:hypothetical protein
MMQFRALLSLIFGLTLFVLACKNENNETKFPVVITKINSCDTITYSRHIKPIIIVTCAINSGCHGTGSAQGDFNTYPTMQPFISQFKQRLIITQDMPKGSAPLPQAQLDLFACWLEAGGKNN